MQELNSGPPKTNPSSGREEDLNLGPPAYKCSALTTRPRSPPNDENNDENDELLKPMHVNFQFDTVKILVGDSVLQ